MRLTDVIVYGLAVAVLIILVRIIWNAPMTLHMRENFTSEKDKIEAPTNMNTSCPVGSTFYMYGGKAYCCSGRINGGADTTHGSCRPTELSGKVTFCTLGPNEGAVKNCHEELEGLYRQQGSKVCPPSKPNYVKQLFGDAQCCESGPNATLTGCLAPEKGVCNVTGNRNPFVAGASSCEFQNARELDGKCPEGYGAMTMEGHGNLNGLTLYGCTNSGQNCYPRATVNRLRELKYDVKHLPICGAN